MGGCELGVGSLSPRSDLIPLLLGDQAGLIKGFVTLYISDGAFGLGRGGVTLCPRRRNRRLGLPLALTGGSNLSAGGLHRCPRRGDARRSLRDAPARGNPCLLDGGLRRAMFSLRHL